MLYVLAYPIFTASITTRLNRFRKAHEPRRADYLPPHVTLVFGLTTVEPDVFIRLCLTRTQKTSQISVGFDRAEIGYDPFENVHKLMLGCTEGQTDLQRLNSILYDGLDLEHRQNLAAYQPHMTVATNVDRSALEQLDATSIGAFPIRGKIRSLAIVELSKGTLTTLKNLPLRK